MSQKLLVIILNWNGLSMLRDFLPSVVENTKGKDVGIVLVDNGSTDGSADWVKDHFPGIGLLCFEKNYGYAGGYDRAIRELNPEYALLLNSDVETPSDWWQPLLAFMEKNPDAGAVQPKILSFKDKENFEHAGAAGGLLDSLGYPYARGRIFNKVESDKGQYDGVPHEIAWASGAAMMVRTKAYIEAGGLDERFFAHMEEIDLCWRMRLKGYKIYAVPESKVYHLGGGSLAYGNPRKTYLNFRNNLLMLHKNLPKKKGRRLLFKRRLMDTLGFSFFLLSGKFGDARAVLRAHRDFRNMRKCYTDFPDHDIMSQLPGTDKMIYKEIFFNLFKKNDKATKEKDHTSGQDINADQPK